MRSLGCCGRLPVPPFTIPATTPVSAIPACWWRILGRRNRRCLSDGSLPALLPIPAAFTPAIAPAILTATVAVPDIGLSVAYGIGIAIAFARPVAFNPATMLLGPPYVSVRSAIVVAPILMAPAPFMSVTAAMMFAIPFMTLATPIATMMIVHLVPFAATVEDVKSIARIPVILIPAAAIAYVVETAAIVAVIIAVERAIGIAAIAVVIIAIAIVIIAKADTGIIIAG